MIVSLLAPFGLIGVAAGLFGLYLASLLRCDGLAQDAAETRHNACLLLVVGAVLLTVSMSGVTLT